MLKRPATDIDIATDATPESVENLFPVARRIGKAFGVVQVEEGQGRVDVATFRSDEGSADGRQPDLISISNTE